MDNAAMSAAIKKQEAELQFDAFNEHTAYAIGTAIRERSARENLPVVIEIQFWDRLLFFAAMPGTNASNRDWTRRKFWVVRNKARSSYRMMFDNGGQRELKPDQGTSHADYALHGGAFPITVRGTGIVGAIIVSGLHERDDHRLIVEALCDHLGRDRADFVLPTTE